MIFDSIDKTKWMKVDKIRNSHPYSYRLNPELVKIKYDSNSWLALNADTSTYLTNNDTIHWEGSELISGINYGKYYGNFKYGFYNIRCKIPDSSFCSYWLSVKNGILYYKEFPEIDVFETVWDDSLQNTPVLTSQCYAWKQPDNRNGKYEAINKMKITSTFYNTVHIIGCLWTPDYIDIYIGSIKMGRIDYKMRTQLKISFSREISTHTIIENRYNDTKGSFLIDYINVYQYLGDTLSNDGNFIDPTRWATSWTNRKNECFNGNWKPREIDRIFSGKFNLNSKDKDELLIFRTDNSPDSVILLKANVNYGNLKWDRLYSSNGRFGNNWVIGNNDKLIVGNFVDNVYSGDDILLVSEMEYAKLISFYNGTMNDVWGNGGNNNLNGGWIGDWRIGINDVYYSFDINGDSVDELLAISSTKYAKILKYNDKSWETIWGNGGPQNGGKIGPWTINKNDIYKVGNFYSSTSGDELICISKEGYVNLLNYNNKRWFLIADTNINNINSKKIIVGDFNYNGTDELTIIDYKTGKVSIINNLNKIWTNDRNIDYIHNLHIDSNDKFVVGRFIDDTISGDYNHLLLVRGKVLGKNNYFRSQMFLSPLFTNLWNPFLKEKRVKRVVQPKDFENINILSDFFIYPNPNNTGVIYFKNKYTLYFELYNANGQLLIKRFVAPNYQLDGLFKSGIYYLRCTYLNFSKTFKLIYLNK